MQRGKLWLWVAGLLALAFALRFLPLQHGLPRNYVPDTHAVRAALGMAKDKDLAPEVGKYSSYPYLMPYLLLPVYASQYVWGKWQGEWRGAEEFGALISEEPERVALPARALVACFGAVTALLVFFAARAAGLQSGALAAMFLCASALLHLQFSVQERPWVIVVFFGAACLWSSVLYAKQPRLRWLVLSGASAGLAFATHQAGLFFAFLTASVWIFSAREASAWRGRALLRRAYQATAAAGACLVCGVLFGHAYYLVHGGVAQENVIGGAQAAQHLSIGGQALRLGLSWDSFTHLGKTLIGYDPVLVGLGAIGSFLAWASPSLRGVCAFTLTYALFFLFNPSDHVRYLLPLTILLALPAGLVFELVAQRKLGRFALALLLALPLLQASRLVWLLRQQDTRAEAEHRLEQLAAPGEAPAYLAIDHYGPQVELSKVALIELSGLRDLRTREAHRLQRLNSGAAPGGTLGVHALFVEELFGFDESTHSYGVAPERRELAETPAEMLSSLGFTHFALVNRTPENAAAPFLAELAQEWVPAWIIDPSRAGRGEAPEAFLPTEMQFPLNALWRVDRPGPHITLYVLPKR
jgi:4-amino-4-deoxy-L-arabinose transferase-like glycosyltransferase